jgi:hypothetical protein
MTINLLLFFSACLNVFLMWYLAKLLKKFMFVSSNLADLYFTTRAFEIFIKTLYTMNSYHGDPILEELVFKTKIVLAEVENFREVFEHTLDEELEEEFNAAAIEEQKEKKEPLFYDRS